MKKIILATSNLGKIKEFQEMLDADIELIPQVKFAVADATETGLTYVENAIIKARHACIHTSLSVIADDSGLEVDALHGEPGVYSARYAGKQGDFQANINKLLNKLINVPWEQRTARFQCILVYMRHARDATPIICQGTWEGILMTEPKGALGFGYDPILYIPDHACSVSELDPKIKNQLSHRAQALKLLLKKITD